MGHEHRRISERDGKVHACAPREPFVSVDVVKGSETEPAAVGFNRGEAVHVGGEPERIMLAAAGVHHQLAVVTDRIVPFGAGSRNRCQEHGHGNE